MNRKNQKGRGWHNEPGRHKLAAYGIKTTIGDKAKQIEGHMSDFGTMYDYEEDSLYRICAVIEQYKPDYVLKHN